MNTNIEKLIELSEIICEQIEALMEQAAIDMSDGFPLLLEIYETKYKIDSILKEIEIQKIQQLVKDVFQNGKEK